MAKQADVDAVAVTSVIVTISLQGHVIEEQTAVR